MTAYAHTVTYIAVCITAIFLLQFGKVMGWW